MSPCLLETGEWGFYSDGEISGPYLKPRYRPGETVYIKETWRYECFYRKMGEVSIQYKDGECVKRKVPEEYIPPPIPLPDIAAYRWRSSRFMPEWASRSHALIVSVRPERIRDITDKDCWKEGADPDEFLGVERDWFQNLWESLHPGSWERNDWVWRIELEKLP